MQSSIEKYIAFKERHEYILRALDGVDTYGISANFTQCDGLDNANLQILRKHLNTVGDRLRETIKAEVKASMDDYIADLKRVAAREVRELMDFENSIDSPPVDRSSNV